MTKNNRTDILFVILTAFICQFLFSAYGFNPTDEGFVLSATNRVLHGQIPHVDFSSVRPLGYAYLHIPELLFSENYFFLISRFVFWFEQILIAFLWIRFVINFTKTEISLLNKYTLVIVCFIFNVHYFPCSVLHTIDGLLMCMIGLNFIISEKKYAFVGFFFIGFASLCKQNYLVILPFTLFLFGRRKIVSNTIIGFLPIALYISIISYFGGFEDLRTQLSGHNELLKVGVFAYVLNPLIYVGIIGAYIYNQLKINKIYLAVALLVFAIVFLSTNHYHGKFGFVFIGIIIGDLIYKAQKKELITIPFITLLIGWCVSISVGYNSPALFIGGIISLFLLNIFNQKKSTDKILFTFVLISCISFYFVRTQNIYRDLPAKNLTYKLDGIVNGACGIKTNLTTYKVLVELNLLKKKYPNILVLPDFTACNILHSHQSKILTEWPNKTEIPNEKILQKVVSKIGNDSSLIFAIATYQTAKQQDSLLRIPNNGLDYPIIRFAKNNSTKSEDYNYFEIYKSK